MEYNVQEPLPHDLLRGYYISLVLLASFRSPRVVLAESPAKLHYPYMNRKDIRPHQVRLMHALICYREGTPARPRKGPLSIFKRPLVSGGVDAIWIGI